MRPAADSKVSVQRMGSLSYRQRESTIFRGVTKTSGTNSGVEKFDVQFVFCDNGTKRHPKIYGFQSAASAARAFDVLTCKRALEKSRTVSSVLASIQSLGTNHPSLDYANEPLLSLLHSQTRDDVIYALKQCAKRGYSLEPSNIMGEITSGLDASRLEAVEKERLGDMRQSYEATVKPSTDKKRKQATNNAQLTNHLGSARLSPDQQQRDLENKGQQPGEMHRQQEDKLAAILAAGLPALSPSSRHPMDSGKAADLAGFASLAAGLLRDSGSAGMNRPLTVIGSAPSNDPSSAHQQFVLQAVQGPNGGDMRVDTLSNSAVLPPLLKSEATALSPAIFESIEFVLECIRLASNTTPELSAAHDLVHIWRCLMQGRPWAQEKLHLPHWYYMGLLPSLQGCTSMSGLFSLCGHLWRSGGLSVMLAAMTGGLPQSTVISLLQNVAAAIPPMQRAAEVSPFSLHPQLQQSGTSVQHALSVLTAAMQQQQGEGGVNPPQDTASALMAAVAAANNGASGGAPAALQRLINQTLCEGKFGGARLPPSPSYLMGGQRMGGPGAWPSSHEQGFQLGSPSFSGRGGPSWSGSLSGGPQNGSAGEGAGEGNPQLTQLLHLLGGGSLQPLQASAPTGHVGQQTVGMYGTAPHLGRSSASAGALQEAVPIEGSSTMMMSSPSKHKNSREGATGFKADSGGKLVEAASRPRRKLARVDIDFLRGELPRTVRGEAGDGARSRASIKGIAAGRSYSVPAARHSSLDFDAVVEAAAAALGADADRKDEERQQQNIQGTQGQEPVSLPQQVIDLRAQDQTMAPSYNSPFLDGGLRGFGAGLPAGTAAGHGSEQAAASGGCEETDPPASPHHPILLSTRSRSLPTRPQPMKAPLTADIRVGTDKADAGKEGSREKPEVPTSTSPFEAPTALHQQPNSAFSKFQHSLQGL